jgi:hypothetical protein
VTCQPVYAEPAGTRRMKAASSVAAACITDVHVCRSRHPRLDRINMIVLGQELARMNGKP